MAILNLGQVAEFLGFKSPASVLRLLKRGLLDEYQRPGPDGRSTYLETEPEGLPTLRQQIQMNTECHFNSPLWRRDAPMDDWTTRVNEYLDHSRWSSPPWTREQWVTLRNVIELAVDS